VTLEMRAEGHMRLHIDLTSVIVARLIKKQEVLGRTNGLLSSDTTRNA
jgi:hypothetical protein